ncbi:uncharacterized protein N7482_001034 [Penicillium canariense]|uniref:BRCT domain-containing protein n=1 Tax=Penicillium canariense TaxID=189055 RepID=A0A9W9LTQ3_9EURO|nr:uncharacterized protein N7482_001034 [Penicillium canariense]KAJ5175157.1 hypothetical protein N7482_001034 [Penicillium canariense]
MARAAVLPPSPVKRGTRTVPRSTVTKTTASSKAKVVAESTKRGVTKSTTARKNTAPIVEMDSDDTEDELGMMMKEHDEKPVRPRGRPAARVETKSSTARAKKATLAPTPQNAIADSDEVEDGVAKTEPVKKRVGRPRKNTLSETATASKPETAPKPRGRPKGATASKTTATTRKTTRKVADPEPVPENAIAKHIRIATNSMNIRSNILRGPAKKKTVTFQEPSDSESEEQEEELTAPVTGRRKAPTKGVGKAGLGATPMRNAAATAGRGRKPAAANKDVVKPLSPKKDKQVAKSLAAYASSDGEEDELSAAKDDFKSPVKLVIHSPVKHGLENTGLSSPVRKINFTPKKASSLIDENGEPKPLTPKHGSSATGLSSPVRKINFTPNRSCNTVVDNGHLALPPGKSVDFSGSVLISSPARRPEPSPFHFSLRDTPNRGLFFREDAKSASVPNLGQGPSSPLKMSPKKAHLGASFSQSPAKSSTPFSAKTSFIQSPAKRIASPFKSSFLSSRDPVASTSGGENTTIMPHLSDTKPRMSPAMSFENDEMTVDKDIEMVEEVARDIFGIELQCYARSSSTLPSPQETPATEELLELEPDEDVFNETATCERNWDDAAIDEQIQELQEEIRDEPEDFGTICFNTMEELQEPFQTLPEQVEHDLILDDVEAVEETDVDEEETPEPYTTSGVFENPEDQVNFTELERMDPVHDDSEKCSPSPSEPTLGLADLEEVLSPTPAPKVAESEHHGYEDTGFAHHSDEEEAESEGDEGEDNGPALVPYGTFNISYQLGSPHELNQAEEIDSPQPSIQHIPPLAPTPPARELTFVSSHEQDGAKSKDWLFDINVDPRVAAEEDSFLETTQSEIPSPSSHAICDTPSFSGKRKSLVNVDLGFTPLARKFDSWETNTPSQARPAKPRRRGIFSLVGPLEKAVESSTPTQDNVSYPDLSRTPLANTPPLFEELPLQANSDGACMTPLSSHTPESAVVEEEHSMTYSPIRTDIFEDPELSDPEELGSEQVQPHEVVSAPESSEEHDQGPDLPSGDDDKENCDSPFILPATPIQRRIDHLRTVHTVSKVPLKGEGEVSPLKLPRKRGLSLESRSQTRSSPRMRKPVFLFANESVPTFSPHKAPRPSRSPSPNPKRRCSTPRRSTGKLPDIQVPRSPALASSPGKTPRRRSGADQQALRGAVVHVDVHTTEGEDASGIFVELLQQMGARCVKTWSWNPQSSMSPINGVDPKESKVGITHVVYKDGGLRTLEKVKHAGGLVKLVGVGWVLDCERDNKWLDESPYIVDSSIIPRGGAKRRKSMEPRALSNVNGTLVPIAEHSTPSASGRRCGADWGAMEGFRKITPPTYQAEAPSTPTQQTDRYHVPATPGYNFANLDAIGMSPATPYFHSHRAQLVQKSCPPKQSNRGLFEGSDKPIFNFEEDDEVEYRRQQRARMEAARRKSHFYKPSVQSPLGR